MDWMCPLNSERRKLRFLFLSTILIAGSFDDARPFHFMRMQSKFIKKISEIVGHISGFICKIVRLIVQTKWAQTRVFTQTHGYKVLQFDDEFINHNIEHE